MLYPVAPCNTLLYFATPCETLQYHAAPCNTLSYHAIPCLTMQYHQHNVISCNKMHHHESPFIPCLISQYLAMITTATDGVSHKVLSCATLMISHRQFLEMCYINCRFSIQTWLQHRSYASSGWGPEGDWASKAGHTSVRRSCAPKPPMAHGHFHTHFVGDKLKHISKDNLINILNVC